jgi:hypothetical protein
MLDAVPAYSEATKLTPLGKGPEPTGPEASPGKASPIVKSRVLSLPNVIFPCPNDEAAVTATKASVRSVFFMSLVFEFLFGDCCRFY